MLGRVRKLVPSNYCESGTLQQRPEAKGFERSGQLRSSISPRSPARAVFSLVNWWNLIKLCLRESFSRGSEGQRQRYQDPAVKCTPQASGYTCPGNLQISPASRKKIRIFPNQPNVRVVCLKKINKNKNSTLTESHSMKINRKLGFGAKCPYETDVI